MKKPVEVLPILLSEAEIDELRVVIEFAGMMALDVVSAKETLSDNQTKALKRIANSSSILLSAISEAYQEAKADVVSERVLH